VEQNNINFVTHTLRPYITKIEEFYSRLLPNDAFLRINVDGLLRGDFATRMQGYSIGSQAGFLSINDIRRFEDLTPVDSGDVYRVPLANVNLAAADLVETDKKGCYGTKTCNLRFRSYGNFKGSKSSSNYAHRSSIYTTYNRLHKLILNAPTSVYKVD
jgi:hypothetical protein